MVPSTRHDGRYAAPVQEAIEQRNLRVAVDHRPHCHAEAINRQVRAGPRRAGEIAVAGVPVCGFDNRWGDGLFTVYQDLDARGHVVRIRVDVGAELIQRRMRRAAHRFQSALVTRAILDDGQPVHFVDRHEPMSRTDSGWILSSGAEAEDEPEVVALPISDLVARYPEVQALLDEPVGARFTRQRDGGYVREP